MAFVADQIINTTVRIETFGPQGMGTGTGFFCRFNVRGDSFMPCIVTNKHVLSGAEQASFFIPCEDKSPPQRFTLGNLAQNYVEHPDDEVDLAAIVITDMAMKVRELGRKAAVTFFNVEDIAGREFLAGLSSVENILMVGYPNGIWDHVNNRPISRTGITASHAAVDFQGKPYFVIDCACFPGSSGSPVILYDPVVFNENGKLALGPRTKLLGILFAGPTTDAHGKLVVDPKPTSISQSISTKVMINLGYCVKAEKLLWFNDNLARVGRERGHEQF